MKILHVLNEIRYSGAEVMLTAAAPFLKDQGFELHALSTGPEPGEYAGTLERAGYRLHHVRFTKTPFYFLQLIRLLRKGRFNVVHIHPERAFFWHAIVARIVGVRTIVRTIHSVFLFSGFLRFKRMIQRWVAKNLLGVKFVSIGPSVSEVERRVLFNKTTMIPNWVDEKVFVPAADEDERKQARLKYGLPLSDIIAVSVGACTEQKNHIAIINAMMELHETLEHITYLHVGEGPLLPDEMQLIKEAGIEGMTRFIYQTHNVREILIASDIFVMPSLYEGLGLSCIEAMSCGLPIVAYDCYGLRDVVVNGRTGFLVPPDPRSLAARIKELASNEKLRKTLGVEARRTVLENFDMRRSVGSLLKLYQGQLMNR